MRARILLMVLFFTCKTAVAQNERSLSLLRQEADKYYVEEQYNLATQLYRELTDQQIQDANVDFRLAECYRKTFNYTEAEAYYLKVYYLAAEQYPLSLYYYALMLKFNANFDESLLYFDEFTSANSENSKLKEYVEQAVIDRAGSEMAKAELALNRAADKLSSLKLNTTYNDFAPAVRDSTTVVITSGRFASNRQSIDERFGEAFTDNYYFEKQAGVWQDKTRQLFSITNSRYNDGSGCFSSKGDKYYFTVCGSDGPQCRIYLSEFKNNKWSEPVPLNANINFKSSESKHPAVSHGGDTLIFASNRNGGYGKFDLWMSINAGDENWGPPMNLGRSVNTTLNEVAPCMTAFSHVLFFASDGHAGYGGVDLYMAKKLSTADTVLYNLDRPFNSSRDDCFLSFSEKALYWSSNRPEGQGGFDVYTEKIPSVLAFISKLSLKRRTATRDKLKSRTEKTEHLSLLASRLEEKIDYQNLTEEKKRMVEKMVANRILQQAISADQFKDLTPAEFKVLDRLAEERYQDYLNQKKSRHRYLANVRSPETGDRDLSITGVLMDSLAGNALPALKIFLIDSLGEVLKITESNENGQFRFTGVPNGQELYLQLETVDRIAVISDLHVSGMAEKVIHFENVYFDFDHYRIRPEASKVLDDLAEQLIRNPNAQLEVFAYADDRGSNQYNLRLTQKRGQSVVDYLIQKGVDQTGVAIIARGKQVQQDADTELQRQYNRRVELYLNGNTAIPRETARTYILKEKTDWVTLSNVTGVSAEKLMMLNGATAEPLKAFQPVRIPEQAKGVTERLFFIGL
jgi:outer membrane protein OmpA-like peptidoglycan-associated protein/tetratricopeptide (TPR) repeat protein